jgi:nitroreductase
MMTGFASGLDAQTAHKWATNQAYIALGFAMAACAEIEVDSCPMEGIDKDAYNTILELPENMKAQVVLPIGFRAADDTIRPKFRFDDIFETRA